MTAEDAFWQALEADPADTDTRLIFADWLEDQGRSVESRGQRWQVRNKKWPNWWDETGTWDWLTILGNSLDDRFPYSVLPEKLWLAMTGWLRRGLTYAEYPTLRDAETALAHALASLDL